MLDPNTNIFLYFFHVFVLYLTHLSVFAVNDTLDDMLDESGDEEESDFIVNQVLDEIGIEMSGKVRSMSEVKICLLSFVLF